MLCSNKTHLLQKRKINEVREEGKGPSPFLAPPTRDSAARGSANSTTQGDDGPAAVLP